MANRKSIWRPVRVGAFYLSMTMLMLPAVLVGKTKPPVLVNPANPLRLGPIPNYTKPVRNSIEKPLGLAGGNKQVAELSCFDLRSFLDPKDWTFTLSASYDLLNDRSRIGSLSLDSDSAIIDLTGNYRKLPWTWFDLSYMYSYANGTAPGGINQTGNQNAGGLRVLQPIPFGCDWLPANLTNEPTNNQIVHYFLCGLRKIL